MPIKSAGPADFSGLVLGPLMDEFAREVTFTPVKSQPGEPAYVGRGIFERDHVMEGVLESDYSTTSPALFVRLADFTVPPEDGDEVRVDGLDYTVSDDQPDGEGGMLLILRRKRA